MGPTGALFEPLGDLTRERAVAAYPNRRPRSPREASIF